MSRLPAIYGFRDYVDAGGLISYGTDRRDLYRRCATYVYKVLSGTPPAALPVEPRPRSSWSSTSRRPDPRPDDPTVAPAAGGSGD